MTGCETCKYRIVNDNKYYCTCEDMPILRIYYLRTWCAHYQRKKTTGDNEED